MRGEKKIHCVGHDNVPLSVLQLQITCQTGSEKELFLKQNCWWLEQNTKWSEKCKNSGHLQRWLCQTQSWTGGKHGLRKRRVQDGVVQPTPSTDARWEALPGSLRVDHTTTTSKIQEKGLTARQWRILNFLYNPSTGWSWWFSMLCFWSGSRLDPDSIRSVDPDSGAGWEKDPQKLKKKLRNFIFWSAWCSLWRAEGFSCSLDVLNGGLGISKFQFLIKNVFFQLYIFSQFWIIKTLNADWIRIGIQPKILRKRVRIRIRWFRNSNPNHWC